MAICNWGDIGTDIVYMDSRNSNTFPYNVLDSYFITSSDQVVYSAFISHYRLIYAVNNGLERLRNGQHAPLDETNRKVVEGEFRFLRAIGYFNLIKIFGNPPLFTQSNTSIDGPLEVSQESNATYSNIVEDLIFAKENLSASGANTKASKASLIREGVHANGRFSHVADRLCYGPRRI